IKNNWPPLPENFPVGPCFYQDFSVDIPVEFQKTVKIMYYLWMCKLWLPPPWKCSRPGWMGL
uniref:Secretory carrier-associated membrane protein n=1 Tax=Strix occidentalis caurina TaxID=311401 RepID=A0A8D0FEA3_STROC